MLSYSQGYYPACQQPDYMRFHKDPGARCCQLNARRHGKARPA